MPYCPKHQVINTVNPGHPDQTQMMVTAQTTEFLHMLNPKNYRYLPSKYTNNIRFAGRQTSESDHVANVLAHKTKWNH